MNKKSTGTPVEIFTDGACSGNPGPGGWAYILRHPASGKELAGSGAEAETTNNRMELTAVVLALVIYRRQMSVWFFSRYGIRMFQRTSSSVPEEEKLFDAFVSYSKKDEAFVAQILAPELECGNPPFRPLSVAIGCRPAGGRPCSAAKARFAASRRP